MTREDRLLIPFMCENCGAPMDGLMELTKCEYCGTAYGRVIRYSGPDIDDFVINVGKFVMDTPNEWVSVNDNSTVGSFWTTYTPDYITSTTYGNTATLIVSKDHGK